MTETVRERHQKTQRGPTQGPLQTKADHHQMISVNPTPHSAPTSRHTRATVRCPHCGHLVPIPVHAPNCVDNYWTAEFRRWAADPIHQQWLAEFHAKLRDGDAS